MYPPEMIKILYKFVPLSATVNYSALVPLIGKKFVTLIMEGLICWRIKVPPVISIISAKVTLDISRSPIAN